MCGLEIKKRIDENNKKLSTLVRPNEWNLNHQVYRIMRENEELQASCEHQFENGVCVYCYTEQA